MRALPSRFSAPPPDPAKRKYVPEKTAWPAAGHAALSLAAPTTTAAAGRGAKARDTRLPVWAQTVADAKGRYAGPAKLDVQVLDHGRAEAAGVNGVLLAVTPAGPGGGAVQVGLDYQAFAQAYGGNYGSRLRLASLPACVLTTPSAADCRRMTLLDSTNDAREQSVSAPTTLGVAPGGAATPMVLAAVSDPAPEGGEAGTYAATDLKPSGSWSGGGSSGSFTYSYPIAVPPAVSDFVPDLALSYDSGSVDGQTVSTQAQSSWVGDGWSTPQSYVEQSFVSCADSPEGSAAPNPTYDQCYDGPILTLSLGGSSTSLVWDKGKQVWKPERDNGEVVTHVVNSNNGTGTYNTDYWQVTDRDGTVYQFGRNEIPGWTSGKPTTNSVDSQPVYSAHSGDPCNDLPGSVCTMAYRWNLDYAKDIHGNAIAYYYKQDKNYYGQNKGSKNVEYVRDSHLDHIDYGFTDGNAYGTPPNRIEFGTSDRCVSGTCSPLNSSTEANWPDVPYDLICPEGKTCTSWSPSYFSTVRLTSITAKQYSPASSTYVPIDSYTLTQTMPPTGDGNSPTLWLSAISHTGSDTGGAGPPAAVTLPPVQFSSILLDNRVDSQRDGWTALKRNRILTVTTETGSVITATYDLPNPCTAPVTTNPAGNTRSCYPVYWTPDGLTDPIRDWFNKWAVTKVTSTDPTGGAPATATTYAYLGGAAWHYDDNEVVKAKYRTYGQFRGYGKVATLLGTDPNPRTRSETTYYRGMSRNNNTTAVTLTDSAGGTHDDTDELAGSELETTAYLGDGGPVDHSTITSYWVSAATATRTRTGLSALTANRVAPIQTYSRQAVTTGGTTSWRYTGTDSSYDANTASPTFGLLQHTYTHTVPADPAYDQCTTTSYAPVNTAKNLVGLVSETEADSVACGGFTQGSPPSVPGSVNTLTAPASVNRPDQVVKNERTFYDDPDFATTFPQTVAPSFGDVTMTRTAATWASGAFTYQTTGRSTYDSYGRVTSAYDGNDNPPTTTEYTMNSVGLTTTVKVTNPLKQSVTTTLDPARALPLTTTDPNGVVTTQQYDTLGRATSVWLNSRTTSQPANYAYTYQVSNSGVTGTTTRKLNDLNGYLTSTVIYDALLRTRQTQAMTPMGGRLITDTFYDTRGWVTATYNGWWDGTTLPAIGNPVSAPDLGKAVHNKDLFTYDGLGRAVIDESQDGGSTVSKTTTVYNGDRTTVIPPTGGVTTTTVVDPLGRTSQLQQYTTAPTLVTPSNTFTGSFYLTGGTTTATTYGYDGHGNQSTLVDAQNNTWTSTYNLLGQVIGKSDPDAGTSTMAYDGNGNLIQSTDARGKTISYTYDAINRKTGKYDAPVSAQTPQNRAASWVYDNSDSAVLGMKFPIGHLTTSTAYHDGAAYITQQKDFNVFGESLGEIITIPATEGMLLGGKTYTFSHQYTVNSGLPFRDAYPVAGGLPTETVSHSSTDFDQPNAVVGLAGYAKKTDYDEYGRPAQETLGGTAGLAFVTNGYDQHTGRLTSRLLTHSSSTTDFVDNQTYDYDLAGNVTKQTDARLNSTTPETQCYRYDTLARLTSAWTATDNCTATPTAADHSTVGDTLGTSSAYWTTWDIDVLGNRKTQTTHNLTGGADTTTSYTYDGNGAHQAHTLTSTNTTGATTSTTSYRYDAAGNMTSRNAAQGQQTLTWNDEGKLTSVTGGTAGNSSYIYDADGNLLLQKDPGSTILYLPGEQLTLNTSTQTVTGTRYYPLPDGSLAIRTGSGTNYCFAITDRQGTPNLYLDYTAQTPTWRQYTPYGQPRGAAINLIDNRGFLNKTENAATGLTHIGAREYDPTTGRFISVDPVQRLADPQQWTGYAYSNNSPITYSDPTGLDHSDAQWEYDHPYSDHTLADDLGGPGSGGSSGGHAGNGGNGGKGSGGGGPATSPALPKPKPKKSHCGVFSWACKAWDATSNWAQDHPVLVGTVVGIGVGIGCTIATEGAGVVGCAAIAGAIGSTITDGLQGAPPEEVVVDAAVGGLTGAVTAGIGEMFAPEAGPLARGLKPKPGCHSFDPDTPVLLADGSKKAIKDVQVGDAVTATDPASGTTTAEKVTALHNNRDVDLTDVSVATPEGAILTLHTTSHHPFWDATTETWVNASQLQPGDSLRGEDGHEVRVASIRSFLGARQMRDLTVDNFHTYYVIAGNMPVLVHNCGESKWTPDENYSPEAVAGRSAANKAYYSVPRDTHELVNMLEANPNMSPRLKPNGSVDTFEGNNLSGPARRYWDSWKGSPIYWNGRPGSQIRIMRNQTTGQIAYFPLTKEGVHNYGSPTLYNW
ncbi:polymorphic toxin-type HINT domain-containing protein [Micromonospora sp. NPDC049559]|uniref:polymorphic toxin-type HINT domain-containing protein n=1 Tax=Micromonospora sp. NPDC049559 TaxID=3155923 RepID=UPI003429AC39